MQIATNKKKIVKVEPKEVQEPVINLSAPTKENSESISNLLEVEVTISKEEGESQRNESEEESQNLNLSKLKDISEVTKQVYNNYRSAKKKLDKIKKYDEELAKDINFTLDKVQNDLYSKKSFYLDLIKEIQLTLPLIAKGELYDKAKVEYRKELKDLKEAHIKQTEEVKKNNNQEFQTYFNRSYKLIASLASVAANRGALSIEEEILVKQVKETFPINVEDSIINASFKKFNDNKVNGIFGCTSDLVGKIFKEDINVPKLPKLVEEKKAENKPSGHPIIQPLYLREDVKFPKKVLDCFPFNANFEGNEEDEIVEDPNDCDDVEIMPLFINVPEGGIRFLGISEIGGTKSKGKDLAGRVDGKVEESRASEVETPNAKPNELINKELNPKEGIKLKATETEPEPIKCTEHVLDDNIEPINDDKLSIKIKTPQPTEVPNNFNSQSFHPIVPPQHGHPMPYPPHNSYPHPDPNNLNTVNYNPYNMNAFCTQPPPHQPPFPYPGYVPPPVDNSAYPQPPSGFVTTKGLHVYSHSGTHSPVKFDNKPRPVKIKSPKAKQKEEMKNWADSDQESNSERRTSSPSIEGSNSNNNKDDSVSVKPAYSNNYLPPPQHYTNNYNNHPVFYPPPYPNNPPPPMYPIPNWDPNNYYSTNSGSNARKNNSNNNYSYKGNKSKLNKSKSINEDKN